MAKMGEINNRVGDETEGGNRSSVGASTPVLSVLSNASASEILRKIVKNAKICRRATQNSRKIGSTRRVSNDFTSNGGKFQAEKPDYSGVFSNSFKSATNQERLSAPQ
ncbi:MAG: hypothetical protein IJX36_03815 [Thermoguttaceae bacterium]|nr:hypothetical protein [Thermoguttaceae bacterium]